MQDNRKCRVFIVGVGRSGTSLLQSMLASHPEICAFPETSFLRRYPFSTGTPPIVSYQDRVLERIPGLPEAFSELGTKNISRKALIDVYLNVVSDKKYGRPALDKDPRLVEYIPILQKSFVDDVKIVHIFRDPRDVLASKKKASWSSGRYLVEYLVASCVQLRDALRAERAGNILSVYYESLIENPKEVLEAVLDYIGLPFDDAVLNHTDAARSLVQESELSWKGETFKSVNTNNSGKWRKDLSPVEAAASTVIARRFFKTKGIELVDFRLKFFEKVKVLSVVSLAHVLSCCYIVKRFITRKYKGII